MFHSLWWRGLEISTQTSHQFTNTAHMSSCKNNTFTDFYIPWLILVGWPRLRLHRSPDENIWRRRRWRQVRSANSSRQRFLSYWVYLRSDSPAYHSRNLVNLAILVLGYQRGWSRPSSWYITVTRPDKKWSQLLNMTLWEYNRTNPDKNCHKNLTCQTNINIITYTRHSSALQAGRTNSTDDTYY